MILSHHLKSSSSSSSSAFIVLISHTHPFLLLLLLLLIPYPVASQFNDVRCKCICPSPQVVAPNDTLHTVPPKPSVTEKPERSIYIGNVSPQQCNCDWVVLPQLTPDVQGKAKEFCPRCECKYESRNMTTIKWVITSLIALIVCLVAYMAFLNIFDPSFHKSRRQYEEQIDDDQTEMREPHDQDPSAENSLQGDEYTQFNSIIRSSPRNSISDGPAVGDGDVSSVVVQIAAAAAAGTSSSSGGGATGVLNRAVQHQNKWKKQVQEQRKNTFDKHTILN